jgi:exopolysaccharide biosynthesis polyprenyl glycosylphosphotransferase
MAITRPLKPLRWRLHTTERRVILFFGDLLVSSMALLMALYYWAQGDKWLNFSFQFLLERPDWWFYCMPFIWIALNLELYDVRRASRRSETLKGIAIAAGICLGLYMLVYFTSEPSSLPRRGVAGFIVGAAFLTLIWRFFYINVFTAPLFMRRVLIVGAGRAGTTLAEILHKVKPLPFLPIGMIDDDQTKIGTTIYNLPVLAGSDRLLETIDSEYITDLILAITGEMNSHLFQTILAAEEQGIEVTTMPLVYEELLGRVPIFLLQSDWILRSFIDQSHAGGFYSVFKRLIDIIGGLIGVVIFVIIYPFIAIGTLIDSGRPVLFVQNRLGVNGQVYKIIKFRTMIQDAEKDGVAVMAAKNDIRVTKFGRFLRRSHLDEVPQFINVLSGAMSLVGPRAERPELVNELQKIIPFYRARLFVKPGLTGWAQTNFKYASSVEDTGIKLEHDLYYIKHRNILLDMMILFRTVGTVVGLRGQ